MYFTSRQLLNMIKPTKIYKKKKITLNLSLQGINHLKTKNNKNLYI